MFAPRYTLIITVCLTVVMFYCTCARAPTYRYLRQTENYYQHDRHALSYTMAGDFRDETQQSKPPQSLWDTVSLQRSEQLGAFTTTVSPYHRHRVLRLPPADARKLPLRPDSLYFRIHEGRAEVVYARRHPTGGTYYLWMAEADKADAHSLLNEYTDLFATIRLGDGYARDVLDDPFVVAERVATDADSVVNYLLPLRTLDRIAGNYRNDTSGYYLQTAALYHAMAGSPGAKHWTEAYRKTPYFDRAWKRDPPTTECGLASVTEVLMDSVADYRVVMFNELHFAPHHRALLHSVLPQLAAAGFTHLALEALWEDAEELRGRGFAVTGSGYYLREPKMANLVRAALSLGMTIVGYESAEGEERESAQANKLYERTLGRDPSARVVVLAGFGHVHEGASRSRPMMARMFQQQYGIPVLTIDQVEYTSTKPGICLVDAKADSGQRIRADLYLSNNTKSKQWPAYVDTTVMLPAGIRGELLQLYVAEDFRADPRAIPVVNRVLIETDERVRLRVPRGVGPLRAVVRNTYGDMLAQW